jgi:hypothetical protein
MEDDHNGRRPPMEDKTSNGRRTLMEDDIHWKTTTNGRQHLMEDKWNMTFEVLGGIEAKGKLRRNSECGSAQPSLLM